MNSGVVQTFLKEAMLEQKKQEDPREICRREVEKRRQENRPNAGSNGYGHPVSYGNSGLVQIHPNTGSFILIPEDRFWEMMD